LNIGRTNGWHTHYNKKSTRKHSLKYKGNKPSQKLYTYRDKPRLNDRTIRWHEHLTNQGKSHNFKYDFLEVQLTYRAKILYFSVLIIVTQLTCRFPVITVDAKKSLPAQLLEPWQIPDQDITLAASRKGSFDSYVSAEKGPEAISGLACPPLLRLSRAPGPRVVRAYPTYPRGSLCSILGS